MSDNTNKKQPVSGLIKEHVKVCKELEFYTDFKKDSETAALIILDICDKMPNDTLVDKLSAVIASQIPNVQSKTIETLLALEAENKRLREDIKYLKVKYDTLYEKQGDIPLVYATCDLGRILEKPTVTTGLLDVVRLAIKYSESYSYESDFFVAIKALQPDVRKMVEGLP